MTDLVRFTAILDGLHISMVVLGIIFMILVVCAIIYRSKEIKERCMTLGAITAGVWFLFVVTSLIIYGHVEKLRTSIHTETSATILEPEVSKKGDEK